jgi:hypothetical protein
VGSGPIAYEGFNGVLSARLPERGLGADPPTPHLLGLLDSGSAARSPTPAWRWGGRAVSAAPG